MLGEIRKVTFYTMYHPIRHLLIVMPNVILIVQYYLPISILNFCLNIFHLASGSDDVTLNSFRWLRPVCIFAGLIIPVSVFDKCLSLLDIIQSILKKFKCVMRHIAYEFFSRI